MTAKLVPKPLSADEEKPRFSSAEDMLQSEEEDKNIFEKFA